MLVGEAPGHNEMIQGVPFVGRAGQLMDKMFEASGIHTDRDVYVSNICRCRPTDNRAPLASEAKTCITYLKKEIELLKPNVIVPLGATSAKYLLGKTISGKSMGELVGRFFSSPDYPGVDFFILYHPAALLYNATLKPDMENHIRLLKNRLKELKKESSHK